MNQQKNTAALLYNLPDDEDRVQVIVRDETIWCTQMAMAQLFGINRTGISRHISNILKEGGNVEENVDYYNLDMIYRVSSLICQSVMPRCSLEKLMPIL